MAMPARRSAATAMRASHHREHPASGPRARIEAGPLVPVLDPPPRRSVDRARAGWSALGVALLAAMALKVGADPALPALALVTVAGLVLARIDIACRRLPFAITVPLFVATAVLLVPAAMSDGWAAMSRGVFSAAVWLGLFACTAEATRGRGMGWGDVVLAPTLGLVLGFLGPGPSVVGFAAGFGLAAVTGTVLMLLGRATRDSSLPFGPLMLAGAALAVFAGDQIWAALAGAGF